MASSLSENFDRIKPNMDSKLRRKVRVVAKIRGVMNQESAFPCGVLTPGVTVNKPKGEASESVTIGFGDKPTSRKDSYVLDYCYEQNEDNNMIFSREVKPLVSAVFDGCKATIIACGARGSGKTYLIQGTDEKPGLAMLAMDKILSMAEEVGKSVSVSFYEVYQDHIHDLLDPKRPMVLVLEDAKGKVQLKGLSQVPVKSTSEFHKLYFSCYTLLKPAQKIVTELPRRSHKGLIIHISSHSGNSDTLLTGKMNFVDLAGYEDSRRKSCDGSNLVENNKINKSLYALHNVVYSLNANESHIPYRESKLTRMLQDSLGGLNRVLMVTCLNPSFCQDSIYMINLASRSCQGSSQVVTDSTKKSNSLLSSCKSRINLASRSCQGSSQVVTDSTKKSNSLLSSCKSLIPRTASAVVKKQTISRVHFSEKKASGTASVMKGRKLFEEASQLTKFEKSSSLSDIVFDIDPSLHEEKSISSVNQALVPQPLEKENSVSNVILATVSSEEENSLSDSLKHIEPASTVDKHMILESNSLSDSLKDIEPASTTDKDVFMDKGDNHEESTPSITKALSFVQEDCNIDKENNISLVNEVGSPPISARLQELSNNLKSLFSSTPLCMKIPEEDELSSNGLFSMDIMEPKTPVIGQSVRVNDKWELSNVNSPWETFSMHSSGVKDSLVKEFLRFLNAANKDELKELKGIGEKRAAYILELREESQEPFNNLDVLKDIGLSTKQIKGMMMKVVGDQIS